MACGGGGGDTLGTTGSTFRATREREQVKGRRLNPRRRNTVSFVAGRMHTAWRHHWRVLPTSQGFRLIMRGTAECNARKTVDLEYPDRHAIWAQEVILHRHTIQAPRNGCTFSTALTIILETYLYVFTGGGVLQCHSTIQAP